MKNADKSAAEMTKREMFCLTMMVPRTGDDELDEIIDRGRLQKVASETMAALESIPENALEDNHTMAISAAYGLVDAVDEEFVHLTPSLEGSE